MKTKYALNNSYFKVNKMLRLPDSILEIAEYETKAEIVVLRKL